MHACLACMMWGGPGPPEMVKFRVPFGWLVVSRIMVVFLWSHAPPVQKWTGVATIGHCGKRAGSVLIPFSCKVVLVYLCTWFLWGLFSMHLKNYTKTCEILWTFCKSIFLKWRILVLIHSTRKNFQIIFFHIKSYSTLEKSLLCFRKRRTVGVLHHNKNMESSSSSSHVWFQDIACCRDWDCLAIM